MSGEEVFARLHQAHPGVPIVFLTAFGSVEGAVLAMRNGAFDYLQKPFQREDLLLVVKRALSHAELEQEVETAERKAGGARRNRPSAEPQRRHAGADRKARRAAATDATVMILGESGTGKEVMARYIHSQSPRKNRPFVPVECSALPGSLIESELFGYERGAFTGAERTKKGLIESADGGTLFLDEIGDLSVELQTRLFRFVEERQLRRLGGLEPVRVDCRILCATNQDLAAKIKAGTFREELYYRLGVVTVKLPPLRERPEDIPHLARFFLERFSRRYGKSLSASPRFYEALLRQPWPGNVRQLKNLMERLTALHPGGVLEPEDIADDLPPTRRGLPSFQPSLERGAGTVPGELRALLRPSPAGSLRRQHQRRGARGRRGSQDVLRPPQAGQGSAGWGIDSTVFPAISGNRLPI